MSNYELWLTRDNGTRLVEMDEIESLDYVIAVQQKSPCVVVLPGSFDKTLVAADRKIEVWREPVGGAMAMERAYMIRRIRDWRDGNANRHIEVTGYDGNYLLDGRIVAYDAGSTQARVTAVADNMLKGIVRENFTTAASDTDRALSTGYFSVQANSTGGPSITRSFSRRNVLGVLEELSEAVKETTGPDVYFDVCSPEPSKYEFRTYTNQPGQDHTYPDGVSPVLLGVEYGNLAEPELDEDYTEEINVVYGGGEGQQSDRYTHEAEDTTRSGRSLWARREGFFDATDETSTGGVQAAAEGALAAGKPKIRFSGKVIDTSGTRYGVHWRCGDKVSAMYEDQQYDCIVKAVHVRLDGQGQETIEAVLSYES